MCGYAINPKSNATANLFESTTPLVIVSAVAPVTSPVCVAFVTLAVLAATAAASV